MNKSLVLGFLFLPLGKGIVWKKYSAENSQILLFATLELSVQLSFSVTVAHFSVHLLFSNKQ